MKIINRKLPFKSLILIKPPLKICKMLFNPQQVKKPIPLLVNQLFKKKMKKQNKAYRNRIKWIIN